MKLCVKEIPIHLYRKQLDLYYTLDKQKYKSNMYLSEWVFDPINVRLLCTQSSVSVLVICGDLSVCVFVEFVSLHL